MIDIHCHILPALDDGAKDEAAALEMARLALEDGVTTVVATPHMREGDFLNERSKILEAVEKFRSVLAREGLPLRLEAGSEVHLGPRLVERIQDKRLLTYADQGPYLLLECPYRNYPIRLSETVFELKLAGITPVIAHPERIQFFRDDPKRFEDLVHQGVLGQMTSSSLLGTFGKKIQVLAEDWVRRRLVHFLGSDAHDIKYRPPRLAEARDHWAALAGEEYARFAVEDYPRALLAGEPIDPPEVLPRTRRPGFFSRLFGG